MKTFNGYYLINGLVDEPENLSEGMFGDIWKSVKSSLNKFIIFIKNSISRLKAGGVTEISIRSLTGVKEAVEDGTWDLTSRIGYYHEFCVGFELAKELRDLLKPETKSNVLNPEGSLKKVKDDYRAEIKDNTEKFKKNQQANIEAELLRAEDGAVLVAEKIISEITTVEDFNLLTFEITHTGTLESGKAKMDVSLMVRKKEEDEQVDYIKASLKLYKKPSINLSNKTFASFINGVLFPKVDLNGKKFLKKFMGRQPEWTKLINQMMLHSDNWKKTKRENDKKKKSSGRKIANAEINKARGFQTIRNGILDTIFQKAYEKDKEGINKRVIETLGLDGADVVYMVIGTKTADMKVISSKTSKEFKVLYEKLKEDFTISFKFPTDPKVVACNMSLEDSEGNVLLTTTYSFKEGDIFVQFLDLKAILPSEYEAA